MKKQYLDYAGLKRVLKRLLPGARKIWHGTEAEWKALSETERDKYDQAEVIDGVHSPIWITGTLTAGQTEIVLSSMSIHESSMFNIYTNKFGITPKDAVVSEGSITLIFPIQDTDTIVKVRVL